MRANKLFAIWLCISAVLAAGAPTGATADQTKVLLAAVAQLGYRVPPLNDVRSKCGDDVLCAAREIDAVLGADATLAFDDTHQARSNWQNRNQSLRWDRVGPGRERLTPRSFDASALRRWLMKPPDDAETLVLDLRIVPQRGTLEEMREFAAVLVGDVPRAFTMSTPSGRVFDWSLPASPRTVGRIGLEVWIGSETTALAAVLAQLLRDHADARLFGAPTAGDRRVRKHVDVSDGWSLQLTRGTVSIPSLVDGQPVIPDGPWPAGAPAPDPVHVSK